MDLFKVLENGPRPLPVVGLMLRAPTVAATMASVAAYSSVSQELVCRIEEGNTWIAIKSAISDLTDWNPIPQEWKNASHAYRALVDAEDCCSFASLQEQLGVKSRDAAKACVATFALPEPGIVFFETADELFIAYERKLEDSTGCHPIPSGWMTAGHGSK